MSFFPDWDEYLPDPEALGLAEEIAEDHKPPEMINEPASFEDITDDDIPNLD
jgi:hypothetical protein